MEAEKRMYRERAMRMACIMKIILAASVFLCLVFAGLGPGAGWAESFAITFGTVACHMLIRFLAPALLVLFTPRQERQTRIKEAPSHGIPV